MLWILVWDPGLRTKRADGERRSSMSWDWDPTSFIERFDAEKTTKQNKTKVCKAQLYFLFDTLSSTSIPDSPDCLSRSHATFSSSGPHWGCSGPQGPYMDSPRPGFYCVSDIPFDTSRNVRLSGVRDSIVPAKSI